VPALIDTPAAADIMANSLGSSENHSLEPSELNCTSFLRRLWVRAVRLENCAQRKREACLPREAETMTGMPVHLRSIVDHDGAVILDIKRDQFFSMNPVGSYIWERLLKGEDLDQISRALAEETGADISVVVADVNDFITDLKSKQLFHFPQ
jgi:hypothetical protein